MNLITIKQDITDRLCWPDSIPLLQIWLFQGHFKAKCFLFNISLYLNHFIFWRQRYILHPFPPILCATHSPKSNQIIYYARWLYHTSLVKNQHLFFWYRVNKKSWWVPAGATKWRHLVPNILSALDHHKVMSPYEFHQNWAWH